MRKISKDIGIFCSTDPVAVDRACLDALKERKIKFKGAEQLDYAERIGMGSNSYELITLE
jgi:uncharacterized Fe-S center protein